MESIGNENSPPTENLLNILDDENQEGHTSALTPQTSTPPGAYKDTENVIIDLLKSRYERKKVCSWSKCKFRVSNI